MKSEYDISDANVRTFHSFGLQLARLSPDFRTNVASSEKQRSFIKASVDRLRSERKFAVLLLNFALESKTHELDPKDFSYLKKYYEYLRNQKYATLNGKQVKSIAERDIANFLFLNQVKFEYETGALWADRNEEYRRYQPDFLLPEYGIWIEHWAIDRQGNVPPWFFAGRSSDPSTRYKQGMEWKRDQFRRHGRELIETYNYQWTEGNLISSLSFQLKEKGVELRELTARQVLDRIWELGVPLTDPLYELTFSLISKAKTNGLKISDVNFRLTHNEWSRKQRAFALLVIPIWQEYESLLKQNDMMDFDDMINYALQVARQQNHTTDRYRHILIDEFQDITDPQLELIKCLLGDGPNTLFCVGDDGQNIFSFAGSNIYNILHFGKRFAYPEQTILSTNYRCPKNIVEASNSIANLNKSRIEKSVVSASEIRQPIRLIEMQSNDSRDYELWELEKATELLKRLLDIKKTEEQIMVLSRFNYSLRRLKLEFPHQETLGLKFLTIHKAKGTEAEYVLLLSCINGRYGFPSELLDQRVLDIVRKDKLNETDKLEEERRLFYVALTRCKSQLFLFTSRRSKSQFVSELEPYLIRDESTSLRVQAS